MYKRSPGTSKAGIQSHLRQGKTLAKDVTIGPSLENCDTMITPDCLRALYSVNYTPVATDKNTYGIGMLSKLFVNIVTESVSSSRVYSSSFPSGRSG